MDAIEALHSRNSSALLNDPAPKGKDREQIFLAALRAPDHAQLRPWRFLCVEGDARVEFGQKMLLAAERKNSLIDEPKRQKLLTAAMRAPLVVIAIANVQAHEKVPEVEQLLSAGSAITNMLIAAHALGYSGIWRTGELTYDRFFMDSMGLTSSEVLVGFIYLGTRKGEGKNLKPLATADYFESWEGELD